MKRFLSLAIVLSLSVPAAAQEKPDVKALIKSAYEKTKMATTLAQFTEVADVCNQILAAEPGEKDADYAKKLLAWALNRRGEVNADMASKLAQQGKTEEAAKLDAEALADFEASIKHDDTKWKAIHNRGVNYAVVGKYVEAVADFTRVIELKADYANAWFNRAEIRYELGKYEDAIADYTECLKLADEAATHVSRGHAYFQLKRFREALADYNEAVRLAPSNAEFLANRADAYRSLAMWEQAANDYRRAVATSPRSGRAYQSAAWFMATCPDERYRDVSRALDAARRAIEIDGRKDYKYLDALAAAQANAGQFNEAKATIDEAIKLAPKDKAELLQGRRDLYAKNKPYRQQQDQ